MFGSEILEVVVGLILVYFVLSVMASALTEMVAAFFGLRANELAKGVKMLLQDDADAVQKFFDHPVIKALRPPTAKAPKLPGTKRFFGNGGLPSYIPADTFARVYLSLRTSLGVNAAPDQVINAFGGSANMQALQKEIERWFDDAMDRVAGWYKRKAKVIVIVFGAIAVIFANADTISMANSLWQDPTIRDQVVAIAERQQSAGQSQTDADLSESAALRDELSSLKILGWEEPDEDIDDPRERPTTVWAWVVKIVGLTITVGAVSMGAPFWFDMMSKLLSLRTAGSLPSAGAAGNKPARTTDASTSEAPHPPIVEDDPA